MHRSGADRVGDARAPAGAHRLPEAMAVADILGREAEVQAVGRFLDGPAPAALILKGPAGIGKTTVWQAALEDARQLGHRVLMTRASQVELAPAMAGLMDLLGDVFDEFGDALPAPQRSALAVALLREHCDDGEVHPGTVFAAALGLVRLAAEESPVLVAVDDLQWLDRATAATLTYTLRRLGDAPVLLSRPLARRTERGMRNRPRSPASRCSPPLDIGSLSRLIARELGQRLPRLVVRRIATMAAGNAFLAIELARVATLSGDDADELSPAALSRSSHVRRLAETRVRVLPEPTRKALAIVAALGEPRAPTLARALHDEAALDPAFDAGVIAEQGGRVRFTHRCWPQARSPASPHGAAGPSTADSQTSLTPPRNARVISPSRRPSRPPRSLARSRRAPRTRSRVARPPRRRSCSRRPSV